MLSLQRGTEKKGNSLIKNLRLPFPRVTGKHTCLEYLCIVIFQKQISSLLPMQDTSQDWKYVTLLTIFMQVLRGWCFLGFVVLGVLGGGIFGICGVLGWILCFGFLISAILFNHSEMPWRLQKSKWMWWRGKPGSWIQMQQDKLTKFLKLTLNELLLSCLTYTWYTVSVGILICKKRKSTSQT